MAEVSILEQVRTMHVAAGGQNPCACRPHLVTTMIPKAVPPPRLAALLPDPELQVVQCAEKFLALRDIDDIDDGTCRRLNEDLVTTRSAGSATGLNPLLELMNANMAAAKGMHQSKLSKEQMAAIRPCVHLPFIMIRPALVPDFPP